MPDPAGKFFTLASFKDKPALLVMFICNHCPYVKHLRAALAQLGRDFQPRGLGIVAFVLVEAIGTVLEAREEARKAAGLAMKSGLVVDILSVLCIVFPPNLVILVVGPKL